MSSQPEWDPKYPQFADDTRGGTLDRRTDYESLPWVAAPPTSHLKDFALTDARDRQSAAGRVARIAGMSFVHVRFFLDKVLRTGTVMYVYKFPDFAEAADWFARLRSAEHPGLVVRDMIAAKVPYEKVR